MAVEKKSDKKTKKAEKKVEKKAEKKMDKKAEVPEPVAIPTPAPAASPSASSSKNAKKNAKKKEKAAAASAAAPVSAPAPVKETPAPTPAPVEVVKSEKDLEIEKLKQQLAMLTAASAPIAAEPSKKAAKKAADVPVSTPAPAKAAPVSTSTASTAGKSTKAKAEAAALAAQLKAEAEAKAKAEAEEDEATDSEWTVVASKKKKRTSKFSDEDEEGEVPSTKAKTELRVRETISVPVDKRGIVMGRSGETIKRILSITGASIDLPKPESRSNDCVIEGEVDQVKLAKTAIKELMEKGYTRIFDPNLSDVVVNVPADKRLAVLGTKGSNIQKIIEATNCKINFPERGSTSEKVQIVGAPEDVRVARDAIMSILHDGFSPITHEGWVKVEVSFPAKYRRRLIGPSGQTIKSIQGNTKCKINIPDNQEDFVIVVGPAEMVGMAEKQIHRLVEKIETPVVDVYEAGFEPETDDEEEEEEW